MWRELNSGAKSAGTAILKALHMMMPTIGVRGLGGFASAGGLGLDEVIDFRNREIGYFTWGAVQLGTSLLQAQYGGYMGLGWKGYKANWSLEEAYQTATYTAVSPG